MWWPFPLGLPKVLSLFITATVEESDIEKEKMEKREMDKDEIKHRLGRGGGGVWCGLRAAVVGFTAGINWIFYFLNRKNIRTSTDIYLDAVSDEVHLQHSFKGDEVYSLEFTPVGYFTKEINY
jgi:hypothetical protein